MLLLAVAAAACGFREVQPRDDSDPAIKARVEAALRGMKDFDATYVVVDVVDGSVTLSGIVHSLEDQRTVDRVVRRVPGVGQVMSNLAVQE